MIDTYFDRVDAANGWKSQRDNKLQELYEDPRYYNGSLYSTMIDRNVAAAKDQVRLCILARTERVRYEIYRGFMRAHKMNRGLI